MFIKLKKYINSIIRVFICIFFLSSCNSNPKSNYGVVINSTTLDITLDENKSEFYNFHISIKKEYSFYDLPTYIDKITVNNKELKSEEYTYSRINATIKIPSNIVTGTVAITAEARKAHRGYVNSNRLQLTNTYILENEPFKTTIKLTKKEEAVSLPSSIDEIRVNDTPIDKSKYIYNNLNGSLTIDKSCTNGDIVIYGEPYDKREHAYQVIFSCDSHCSVSIYESKDYSKTPTKSNIAYSANGDTGELIKDGSGQVNFLINVDDGYDIDCILPKGLYKNSKGKEETMQDDTYRITKINGNMTCQIITKKVTLREMSAYNNFDNNSFEFSWKLRNKHDIDKIHLNVVHNYISEDFYPNNNKFTYENADINIPYTFTFKPIYKSGSEGEAITYTRILNKDIKSYAFPRVEINTKNHVLPLINQEFWHPTKGMHEGNDSYVKTNMTLYDKDNNVLYNSSNYKDEIKYRGNASALRNEKKSIKLKLNKASDLLKEYRTSIPGVDYSNKQWILLRDSNNLIDLSGFALMENLNFDYCHAYTYISLYINNDFNGLYILTEDNNPGTINEYGHSRYPISGSGYLLEHDLYGYIEDAAFPSLFTDEKSRYVIKSPGNDEINQSYINNVQEYIVTIENLIKNLDNNVSKYIDITSFARWLLFCDWIYQRDYYGSNKFLYRVEDDDTCKLTMGSPWDFELCMSNETDLSPLRTFELFYYPKLLKLNSFQSELRSLFDNYKNNLDTIIDKHCAAINGEYYNKVKEYEKIKYNINYLSFDVAHTEIKRFFNVRKDLLERSYPTI